MKKKTMNLFFKGFVKSCLYLLLFVGLFFISYKGTKLYLTHNQSEESDNVQANITSQGTREAVAFNLLFAIDEDSGSLKHMVLEVLNTNTDDLFYITIPLGSQITLSNEMYQTAMDNYAEIPQIIRFSALGNYMEMSDFYEFSKAVLEDYLDVDISFYTVIENEDFNTIFKKDKTKNYYIFKDSFEEEVSGFTEDEISTYLEEFYDKSACNLSLSDRLTYAESLSNVDMSEIVFGVLPGVKTSKVFDVDVDKANDLFAKMRDGASLEEIEAITGEVEQVSLGYNIEICNGSGITGLAASYQTKLNEAGYTVNSISNYDSQNVSETIIRVGEEGLGVDLYEYFNSATIEVADDLPANVDIQIVLGASEATS